MKPKKTIWQWSRGISFVFGGGMLLGLYLVIPVGPALYIPWAIIMALFICYTFWIGNALEEHFKYAKMEATETKNGKLASGLRVFMGEACDMDGVCLALLRDKDFVRYFRQMTGNDASADAVTKNDDLTAFVRENVWKYLPKAQEGAVLKGYRENIDIDPIEYEVVANGDDAYYIYYPCYYKPKNCKPVKVKTGDKVKIEERGAIVLSDADLKM